VFGQKEGLSVNGDFLQEGSDAQDFDDAV